MWWLGRRALGKATWSLGIRRDWLAGEGAERVGEGRGRSNETAGPPTAVAQMGGAAAAWAGTGYGRAKGGGEAAATWRSVETSFIFDQ